MWGFFCLFLFSGILGEKARKGFFQSLCRNFFTLMIPSCIIDNLKIWKGALVGVALLAGESPHKPEGRGLVSGKGTRGFVLVGARPYWRSQVLTSGSLEEVAY